MERRSIRGGSGQRTGRRQFLTGIGAGLFTIGAGVGSVEGDRQEESAVTVRLDNAGGSAWELTATDDDQVADVGAENPTLTLTIGTRYRFVNDGESGHPLEFRDADGRAMLSQSTEGEFEDRDGVAWEADDDAYEYAFTLTGELADRLDSYWCRIHRSMNGQIQTVQQRPPAAVAFQDQSTSGTAVIVNSVRLDDGGFLVIHDDRLLDGQPVQSVRGVSAYLEASTEETVEVSLDEPLSADATLIAMAHRDDPADQAYTFVDAGGEEDPPYTDAGGDAIIDTAEVTVTADQEGPEVAVSLDNVGARAWELTTADSGVAPVGPENPTLQLRIGSRYTIENGGWSGHPLAFRDEADEPLLTQSGEGRFENDPQVGWTDDGSELVFTVTEEFAAAADDYVCTVHPSMEGNVEILPADAPAAAASLTDQESDGRSVVVDSVRLDDGGFLTIHDDRLLDGQPVQSVRGVSTYLDPGVYDDLEVTLDEPLTDDETLIAMPHRDDPADQAYTFVDAGGEEDPPYLDGDGNAVVDDASVAIPVGDTQTETQTPTDTPTAAETATPTAVQTATETDSSTPAETDDDSGPGFGPAAGIAGIGSFAAYALRRLRARREPPTRDDDVDGDPTDGAVEN